MADIYVDNATPGSNTSPYDTWAKAALLLSSALAVAVAGDTIWVKNTHSEVSTASVTETCPNSAGLRILCTSSASQPPTSLTTGAQVRTSGAFSITVDGFAYIEGIEFKPGETSASSSASLNFGSATTTGHGLVLNNCKCTMASTATPPLQLGPASAGAARESYVEIQNTTFKFASVNQGITLRAGRIRIKNMALDSGVSSTPTSLFKFTAGVTPDALVEASDLSAKSFTNMANVGVNGGGQLIIRECKLPSGVSITTGTNPDTAGPIVKMHNCDSGNTNYSFQEQYYEGTNSNENTLVKTGGASDGVTPESFKMVSSANTQLWTPLRCPEFIQKVTSVGSALTCTVDFLHDNVTGLKDNEIWLEIEYLSDTGSPLGSILTDRCATVITAGSTQPSSSASWTTTGMSNPNTQKLQVTFTPQQKGYLICRVALAKASYTVYVDFKPTIA